MSDDDPHYSSAEELRLLVAELSRHGGTVWGFSVTQIYPVIAMVTRAVEAVLTIQARHRLGSIKLLSQTVDPLYRPGEYQECVLDSISKAGAEYNDPSFEPLVVALRFLRSIFELRKKEMLEVIQGHNIPIDFRVPSPAEAPPSARDFPNAGSVRLSCTSPLLRRAARSGTSSPRRSGRSSPSDNLDPSINYELLDRYCRVCRHVYMEHVEDVIHRIQQLVDAESLGDASRTVEDEQCNEEKQVYSSFCLKPEWVDTIEGKNIRSFSKYPSNSYEFRYEGFTRRQLTRAVVAFKEERYDQEDMEHIFAMAIEQGSCLVHSFLFQAHLSGKGPYKRDMRLASSYFAKLVEELANGDPEAQYVFGYYCWYEGFMRENRNLSVMWYMRSAAQGYPAAVRNLGLCFQALSCMDSRFAMELFELAYHKGDSRANFSMANTYYMGDQYVEVDCKRAMKGFMEDIEYCGRRCSMRRMGEICYFGRGMEPDLHKAKEWFLRASQQGDVYSNAYLGDLYYYEHGLGEDIPAATKWYRKAADKNNYYGYLGLGFIEYYKHSNPKQAVVWFEKAARLAKQEVDPDAWYMLGLIYCLKEKNFVKARAYYERAAIEGHHTDACYMLAELYSQEGCERSEYMKWCELASELGHRYSQFILAAYSLGDKSYARRKRVIQNYERAGAAGTGMAYTHLGHLYYEGFLVAEQPDIRKALEYYHKASIANIPDDEAKTWAQFVKYKISGSVAGRYWTPETHVLFSEKFQSMAMTLLLVHRRPESPLHILPLEMVHHIIRCMPVDIPEKLPLFPSIMGVIKSHYRSLQADIDDIVHWARQQEASAIIWGCKHQNLDVVARAIDLGESLSVTDAIGDSPLHIACAHGNKPIAETLLSYNADPAALDSEGRTPVQLAVDGNHEELVEFLVENDHIPQRNVLDAVMWAKGHERMEFLWTILQKVDVNQVQRDREVRDPSLSPLICRSCVLLDTVADSLKRSPWMTQSALGEASSHEERSSYAKSYFCVSKPNGISSSLANAAALFAGPSNFGSSRTMGLSIAKQQMNQP